MRVRWWLVFLGGAVLVAVGITLLGGLGQALGVFWNRRHGVRANEGTR